MSIEFSQVAQRIQVRWDDGTLRRPSRAVAQLMQQLGLAAYRDDPHRPVRISARELARRMGLDPIEGKAVRRAVREAERLGLIRRESPPIGALGTHPAWPIWLHPALIEAAGQPRPWQGPPLVFPRAWTETQADLSHSVTWGVEMTGGADPLHSVTWGVKMTRRKGMCKHTPPASPGGAQAGQSGRARQDPGPRAEPRPALSFPCPQGGRGGVVLPPTATAQVPAALSSGAAQEGDAVGKGVRGKPLRDVDVPCGAFWEWLAGGLAEAGWGGGVEFIGQRRKKDGERGGQFTLGRCTAGAGLGSAARAALAKASAYGRGTAAVEVTFRLAGDLHPLLLADDLDAAAAGRLAALPGVALIETSPGNWQASLIAPRPLTAAERVGAQRALARRLGGDPGAVTRSQLRRPPGSVNGKPSLPEPFVARLAGAPRAGVVPAQWLEELLTEGMAAPAASSAAGAGPARRAAGEQLIGTCAAGRDDSGSGQDFGWLMRQLTRASRASDAHLLLELMSRAAARARRGKVDPREHEDYARRTLAAAHARLALQRTAGRSRAPA